MRRAKEDEGREVTRETLASRTRGWMNRENGEDERKGEGERERKRENEKGDPKRPEAKWLLLMYKIKKSVPFALACGLSRTERGNDGGDDGTCAPF